MTPELKRLAAELRDYSGRYPCVRSGYCCKKATCTAGLAHGAEPVGCKFLKGDTPGEYSCGLVEAKPELAEQMAIGAGCCSPMNSTRHDVIRQRDE